MIEINKVYNEDCLNTLSKIDNQFIDLVVTSPPYNMRTRIRNGKYTTREKSEHFSKKYSDFSDDLPIDDFYKFHKSVITELLRTSKTICYNFQIVTGSKEAFFKIIGDFNKSIKDIIIWDKVNGQPAMHSHILNSCYEMILILESDNKAGRMIHSAQFKRGEMNNIIRLKNKDIKHDGHSASFPVDLPKILINSFSKEDDLIYDPFGGTGKTAVACIDLKRNFIISEISEKYALISNNNIKNKLAQTTLL